MSVSGRDCYLDADNTVEPFFDVGHHAGMRLLLYFPNEYYKIRVLPVGGALDHIANVDQVEKIPRIICVQLQCHPHL